MIKIFNYNLLKIWDIFLVKLKLFFAVLYKNWFKKCYIYSSIIHKNLSLKILFMKIFLHKICRNLCKIWSLNLRIVTLFSRMKWVFECKRKPFFQNFMCRKNHDKFLKFFNFRETCKRAFQNLNFRKVYWEKFLWKKDLIFWKK